MFCPKCGSEVQEGQTFCGACGNRLYTNADTNESAQPGNEVVYENAQDLNGPIYNGMVSPYETYSPNQDMPDINRHKSFNKKILIPIIAGVLVLIFVIVAIVTCSGRSAEGAIKEYLNAIEDSDEVALSNAMIPDSLVKKQIKKEYDGNKEKYYRELGDEISELKEDLEDQDFHVDRSYEITKKGDLNNEKVDELNERVDEEYDVTVDAASIYKVEQNGADTLYFRCIKIDGKWYVVSVDDDFDSSDLK